MSAKSTGRRGKVRATKLAGGLLAGRYAFIRELGQGASGRVILVRDEGAASAPRALKVVPRADAARLSWEHELLTAIAHPNLASVHELVTLPEGAPAPFRLPPGSAALVEAVAPGVPASDAASRVAVARRVSWALSVGIAVARALGAIHRAGLVHGDVKPENIVVDEDPMQAVLIDLGLARPPGLGATAGGTPAYLAPEAWQGHRSTAVDLFALGATLHQLLGGESPLADTRSTSIAELWARANASPRDTTSLPAAVPASFRRLLEALLDIDPEGRPSSARDVVARLSSIQRELGDAMPAVPEEVLRELSATPTEAERAMALSALALVGRDEEVAMLEAILEGPGVVIVRGPTGAGRTRLVEESVRRVQRRRALSGAAMPTFLRSAAILPESPGHDAVLLVEEAEDATLGDARALVTAAELDGHQLVVVLERTSALEGADHDLLLGALDQAGVAALLTKVDGQSPGPGLIDGALEASGGLPGRLCRLLAGAILDGRDITRPEALRATGDLAYSPGVLPARGVAVAEYLAVAGGTVAGGILTDLLGPKAAPGLSALGSEGAVSFGPDGWPRLRRDLVVALHRSMAKKRRRSIAVELVTRVTSVTARAFALSSAGDPRGAARSLTEAIAERRRSGDVEGAVGLIRLATALFVEEPTGLVLALADALRARGRYGEALLVIEAADAGDKAMTSAASCLRAELLRLLGRRREASEVIALIPRGEEAEVHYVARATEARIALDGGDPAAALALGLAAADDAASTGHRASEARAAEVASLGALYSGDMGEAGRLAERALSAVVGARSTGGTDAASLDQVEARIHAVAASVALGRGEVHRAAERYGRAFELAEAAGERHAAAAFLLNLGVTRLDAGDLGPATTALREGARRLARLGRDLDLSRALYNVGLAGVLTGDDDLARVAVQNARRAADRAADHAAAAFATILEAELALRGGRLLRAREAADEAQERTGAASPRDRTVVAARRALILAALGDVQAAKEALALARRAAEEDGSDLTRTEAAVAAARVALAAGSPKEAQEAAAEALAAAARFGTYEARLRAALSSADAADAAAAPGFLAVARALLDTAANTLPPVARARMRAVPAYQRAFGAVPQPEAVVTDPSRWRRLVFYARRLTAERRVGRLYEEVLDAAVDLTGAERGFIIVREEDGSLRVRIARGLDRREIAQSEHAFSRSVAARAIDTGAPISTVDALSDERLDGAASVHALALRSVLAVPLRQGGEVRGAIYLDDRLRPGAFGRDDVALLSDLSDLSAIALDGAERLRRERRLARRLEARGRHLEQTVEAQALQLENLRSSAFEARQDLGIIGQSAAMNETLALVARIAPSNVSVVVTGESGTGKELIARAIHRLSQRAERAFVIQNVSAIPETLLESELFGHVRGAFTGADRARIGLFEAADGGTLFLDEVGEMSPAMQAKLLRAVQDGEVRPVGGEHSRKVDVRVVVATHRDLPKLVEEGSFREDLYYRLAVVTVAIAPLRDRPEDVPPLVAHFLERHGEGRPVSVGPGALARLARCPWPGNVRQLENEIQRALVLSHDVIGLEHLSPTVRGDVTADSLDGLDLKGQVRVLERRLIKEALERAEGNQTRAAKLLGVSRYGLQKMQKRLLLK